MSKESEYENTEEDKSPGIFGWRELLTSDTEGSEKFYTELLGWKMDSIDMGCFTYNMFMNGEVPVAGMIESPSKETPPSWLNYITVENLQATVAKAKELGASECVPITEVPGKGKFAAFSDPQGAQIAFWEHAE